MELPLTYQETSMWQEAPKEDWMVIPVQATRTSSLLNTAPVELNSGRISLVHVCFSHLIDNPTTRQGTSM